MKIKILVSFFALAPFLPGFSQPTISNVKLSGQPQTTSDSYHPYKNFSASPGADVTLTVTASGAGQLGYQWRFNQNDVSGKTTATLRFPSLQLTNAGNYTVVVTNFSGSVTSQVVTLTVDQTFTKITTGPIVTDVDHSPGGTWGDYNNDGLLDLFVYNGMDGASYAPFLYRNNGDGTFTKITSGAPVNLAAESYSACWGDYDNDGNLDLFLSTVTTTLLYHNNGDGTFTRITSGPLLHSSSVGTWVDYDNDGFLDMFLANWQTSNPQNALYRNNGNATFSAATNNTLVIPPGSSAWADYDNDGHMDVFVYSSSSTTNRLYHNNGDGTFTRITTGRIVTDVALGESCAWADYDNDGYPDLFVANDRQLNFLYHNNGDGTFTSITNSIVANDPTPFDAGSGGSVGCAWGDYDNDGWLDLYVGNEGWTNFSPPPVNFLYHNNGDGTFTKITNGSPVNEYSDSWGVTWGDYDNDGFLDLFASRGDGRGNYLYHNNGNSNAWLEVKLVGTESNRAAIGAKVRVHATIGGTMFWQLRQITGGSGLHSGNELQANFGLGDATNADIVRIEWPSGLVQEFQNVAAKQILTITEPPRLLASTTNGAPQFFVKGGRGFPYRIDSSPDLSLWSSNSTVTITNMSGTAQIIDSGAPGSDRRFYRAVSQ